MALDVWFRDDVLRILGAVVTGVGGATAANKPLDEQYAAAYRQGFEDAVRAVGVGFGVVEVRTLTGGNSRRGVVSYERGER